MGNMVTLHRSLPTIALLFLLFPSPHWARKTPPPCPSLGRPCPPPRPAGPPPSPYCKRDGVKCDSSSYVADIDLASKSLTTLPTDLSSLSRLQTPSLQRNGFSGPIPNLRQSCLLAGNLPRHNEPSRALVGLTSLQTLGLSNNFNLDGWAIRFELNQSMGLSTFYAAAPM